jgi:tRNA (guanosine-2'-O-)-methyltransferase
VTARARAAATLLAALAWACAPQGAGSTEARAGGAGLPLRAAVPTAPELCGNAVDDNGNGLADEGCGMQTGALAFLAAWDEPSADVDLRVIDPDGELAETGRPTASGLVKERDCPGRDGECRGKNLENVYLEQGEVLRGDYRVRIRLVSLGVAEPPIAVRFAARLGPRAYGALVTLDRAEVDWEVVLKL